MQTTTGRWIIVIISMIICAFAESQPDSAEYYYFIKEDLFSNPNADIDTLAEIIEICTTEDSISTPSGFTEVTLSWLHDHGYKSCSEAEEDAAQNNDIDEDLTDGYYKSSWINRIYYYAVVQWKRVYCGSKTSRSWYMPGKNYLNTLTRYKESLIIVNHWPYGGGWGYRWGWSISHTYVCQYPVAASFLWRQNGSHKWSSGGPSYQSLIERTW